MLYVNTRHQLPQISIHQNWSTLNRSAVVPAQVHGNNEQASSNKGATQPTTEIDNYQSRRAYGARNMTDYTRERGEFRMLKPPQAKGHNADGLLSSRAQNVAMIYLKNIKVI